jgi:DnaJ family protein A protein 2
MSPYSILGVSKTATDEEIKQAYKKLAREHHPDKGGNKETFQKIQEAYETLSNPDKRSEYDNPPQNFDFHQFTSFFNHHMHTTQKQIQKCADHYYTCNVSLHDIYFGITKKLRIKRERICQSCLINCNTCHGSGIITQTTQFGPMRQIIQNSCTSCNGRGKKNSSQSCSSCNSLGIVKEERLLEINIEKGSDDNKKFIFPEWGEQAVKSNQIPGDFIVKIHIQPHPQFIRQNLDLIYTTNISLVDSIIGTVITIPHFDSPITMDTRGFGIINPNKQYTLFGKGMNNQNNTGNLHLRFTINYPEKTLNNNEHNILYSAFKSIGFTSS